MLRREVVEGADLFFRFLEPRHRLGEAGLERLADLPQLPLGAGPIRLLKIVRTVAATIACAVFGTRASRFRRKCTRQRCPAAPTNPSRTACLRPGYASQTTSCTPWSPRPTRLWKHARHSATSSLSPISSPNTSRTPSARTP